MVPVDAVAAKSLFELFLCPFLHFNLTLAAKHGVVTLVILAVSSHRKCSHWGSKKLQKKYSEVEVSWTSPDTPNISEHLRIPAPWRHTMKAHQASLVASAGKPVADTDLGSGNENPQNPKRSIHSPIPDLLGAGRNHTWCCSSDRTWARTCRGAPIWEVLQNLEVVVFCSFNDYLLQLSRSWGMGNGHWFRFLHLFRWKPNQPFPWWQVEQFFYPKWSQPCIVSVNASTLSWQIWCWEESTGSAFSRPCRYWSNWYHWTKSSFAEFLVEWILCRFLDIQSVSHSFVQNSMAPLTTAPRGFCVQLFCALTNQAEARNTAPYLGAEDPHGDRGFQWGYHGIYLYMFII